MATFKLKQVLDCSQEGLRGFANLTNLMVHNYGKESLKNSKYFDFSDSYFNSTSSGLLFEPEQIAINPKLFEQKFPNLAFLSGNPQIDNFGSDSANTILSRRLDFGGGYEAGYIGSSNGGEITLSAEGSEIKVHPFNTTIKWNDFEVGVAREQGYSIIDRLYEEAVAFFYRTLDEIAITNSGKFVTQSLSDNNAYVKETMSSPIPRDANTNNGQDTYRKLINSLNQQLTSANNIRDYSSNNCLMSVNLYNVINTMQLNQYNAKSVLSFLKDNFPDVNFRPTARLNYNGSVVDKPSDAEGKEKIIIYSDDPNAMVFRLPTPLRFYAPSSKISGTWNVSAMFRTAGVDILIGDSGRIISGV